MADMTEQAMRLYKADSAAHISSLSHQLTEAREQIAKLKREAKGVRLQVLQEVQIEFKGSEKSEFRDWLRRMLEAEQAKLGQEASHG